MISLKMNNKKIIIKGHANYADYGKDIVCASVSSIICTAVNNILTIDEHACRYSDDSNLVTIEIIQDNALVMKLFDNLKLLLKEVESKYPKNIKIESEE